MQGKGLVTAFGIAVALICLYQLSFTWLVSSANGKADKYANNKVASLTSINKEQKDAELERARRSYLDSISAKPLLNLGFTEITYDYAKSQQLNLGLDLQGGMSVVLQVSMEDLIRNMANGSTDPAFVKALADAKANQKNSDRDLVTLFSEAYTQANPNGKLATIFSNSDNRDRISPNASNADVLKVIRQESDAAFDRTFEIMRTRIDKFGVASPNINAQKNAGRIVVELPGAKEPERIRKLLQATAQLEFWEMYESSPETGNLLGKANTEIKKALDAKSGVAPAKADTTAALTPSDSTKATATAEAKTDTAKDANPLLAGADTAKSAKDSVAMREKSLKENPLFAIMSPSQQAGTPILGFIKGSDTAKFNEYLNLPGVKGIFPSNFKFIFGAKPNDDVQAKNIFEVYAVKGAYNSTRPTLEGDVVTGAREDYDAQQKLGVTMSMNAEGSQKWRKMTAENVGKFVGIALDNSIYSAPRVNGEIAGGNTQITGSFTMDEAKDLANILKAGKLPAPARIVEEAVVGPTLGAESITAGTWSLIAGVLAVLLFMFVNYANAGLIANAAVLLNLFFILGILASLGANLTLPGMAGIVLTVGMAVDANVLIFERIREELMKGVPTKKAISEGYNKSFSAIIDSNLTTLLTAFILFYFGLGPVLGFATVLIIGIFSSLFTAIGVSHVMIEAYMKGGRELAFYRPATYGLFKNVNFDFMGKRRIAYIITLATLIISIASFLFKGFELGVDFQGGRNYVVRFDKDVRTSDVASDLAATFGTAPVVRTYGGNDQVKITTAYLINEEGPEAEKQVLTKLHAGLGKYIGDKSYDDFVKSNIQSSQKVGPSIADDIRRGAIWAAILAILGVFVYVAVRFPNWKYGAGAAIAMAHDAIIVTGLFSLFAGILPFSLEIDQHFIAAILTIIGYSVNDTVVVFDRIREHVKEHPKAKLTDIINHAVGDTLSRTINTSMTVLLVVIILFIFGGDATRGFAFALMIGVLVGTYSSIFVAAPIVADLTTWLDKRNEASLTNPTPTAPEKGKKSTKTV
ncbi:MAG: protein translocase subunit SecDF [Chitinophagales bacterium]|nr:protein translocase subunit SecDF [Chitinophagales bacterium]